jgi:hypothetical protein
VAPLADRRVGRRLRLPGRRRRAAAGARWRAARHGLAGELVDVAAEQIVPSFLLVERFLA